MYVHKPWKTFFAPTIIKYDRPTVNDYQYDVPTIWLDKTSDICYMLVDNTMNGAVWISRENSNSGDSVWTLYGDNAVRFAGNVGVGIIEPDKKLTVAGSFGAGTNGTELTIDVSGNISCGSVNSQTISSAASFTGTVNATTGFKVSGDATSGNVLRGDGTNFISSALTKSDVGLGNVDNTSDANKPISSAAQSVLDLKADLVNGKVPSSQLPSNVGLELGESSINAYYGDKGKVAYDHSLVITGNPHAVTKSDVGLGNVDNTTDMNKPVSTAVIQTLLTKADLVTGKVPLEQLPSMTYNLVSYANISAFPSTGNANTYYVALDTMYVYLWSSDVGYVMITGSLTIADNSVTMAKIQNIANNTVIGNVSGAEGDPSALTAAQLRTLIGSVGMTADGAWAAAGDIVVGTGNDTAAILSKGSSGQVLTAGASTLIWQTPATGGGTITDVTGTSPIVSSGGTTPAISLPAATNAAPGHATAAHITAIEANTAKTTNATHTGDVTGSGALTIAAGAVTLAKMANVATGSVLYRRTTGTGLVEATALADLKTDLAVPSKVAVGAIDTGTDDAGFVTALKLKDSGIMNLAWTGEVNGLSAKSPLVDADIILIEDSAASYGKKKVLWSAIKSTAKTYFDTIYAAYGTAGYDVTTARTDLIASAINDSETTKAPCGNAVFDGLALKANLTGATFTGTVVAPTITANTVANIALLKLTNLTDLKIPYNSSTNGMLSSSLYFNTTNNGIGVNQSAPTAFLDIAAATTTTSSLRLRQTSAVLGTINLGDLWFYLDGSTPRLNFRKTASETVDLLSVSANLWSQNSSYVYYNGGNVGIGINTPDAAKLVVYGSFGGRLALAQFQNTNVAGYVDVSMMCGTSLTEHRLSFGRCGSSYTANGFANGAWLWNYGSGKLSFGTGTGASIEKMAIYASGYIGINKTDPISPIHIYKARSAEPVGGITPGVSGGTGTQWYHPVVCVEDYCTYASGASTTDATYKLYPAFLSRSIIETGAGGEGPNKGSNHWGLVHDVYNKGMSQDCAAVHHLYYAVGQTAGQGAETTGFYGYYYIDGAGDYMQDILETQQTIVNCGSGTAGRGFKGWLNYLTIYNTAAANAGKYNFIEIYNALNIPTNYAINPLGNNYIANCVVMVSGQWRRFIGSSENLAAITTATSGYEGLRLTITECGIDLYTNVVMAANVPALKMTKNALIDLRGENPGTCYIKCSVGTGYEGGLYMTIFTPSNSSSALGLYIQETLTQMRIAGVLKNLTVDSNGFVKAAS